MTVRMERILVVDDDRTIRESLKKILMMEGFKVDTAETGLTALEKIENQLPDIVIINDKLPDMKGETLRAKIHESAPHTKTIILGIQPISPSRLLEIVNDLLKKQH